MVLRVCWGEGSVRVCWGEGVVRVCMCVCVWGVATTEKKRIAKIVSPRSVDTTYLETVLVVALYCTVQQTLRYITSYIIRLIILSPPHHHSIASPPPPPPITPILAPSKAGGLEGVVYVYVGGRGWYVCVHVCVCVCVCVCMGGSNN